jgi:hypothetical protein
MTINNINPGDIKKLTVAITDEDGALGNPDSLKLEVQRPDGEILTQHWPGGDITEEVLGSFFARVELTEAGAWQYRWQATGIQFNERGTLFVGIDTITADPFPAEGFTVAEVWGRSPMLKSRYPSGAGDGDLVLAVAVVAPLVGSITGRSIAGMGGEAVPEAMQELALRAIALKTEQFISAVGTAKGRKLSLNRGNLASFSAGSYSESYFGPGQMISAKKLDADPILAEVLWALCTEQAKLEWLSIWDPADYPLGTASVVSYEYGNRPNYSPYGFPRVSW